MKTLLSYPLSIIYYFCFGMLLLIFHPIQWLCLHLGGYNAHRRSVVWLNFFITKLIYILGGKVSFRKNFELPEDAPLIVVANHQSLHDIPPFFWYMRKYHPKFVSKIELGKGLPSVSYNLRHGGSALINRKDPKQALSTLLRFGKYLEKNNYTGIIFPEGTRSKTGVPKRFSSNGLKMLTKTAPSAYVVPVTINNSWKLLKNGNFPLELGVHLKFDVHEPIKASDMEFNNLFEKVEETVKNAVV